MSNVEKNAGLETAAPMVSAFAEPSFTWRHRYKLDPQFRVQCPVDWRPADPNFEFMLIAWPHRPTHRVTAYLKGLTHRKFLELEAKFRGMSMGDAKTEALRRAIFRNSIKLKLDSIGRFVLPKELCEQVGLSKEVYFEGGGDQFGMWNEATYLECSAAESNLASEAYDLV